MKKVRLAGILNITPDSFSDGGLYVETNKAVAQAHELFRQGATIVDIGAESTNPKAALRTPEEEWQRLEPVIRTLLPKYAHNLSIDSYHPETIERIAQEFGSVFIANDVTGMNNGAMRAVVAQRKLRCIISHLPAQFGTDIHAAHADATMDDEREVLRELLARKEELLGLGLTTDMVILDPGIGFGKTTALNKQLLMFPRLVPDSEVMIGYSRKRFLGEDRFTLEPNLAAARIAIAAGVSYLRVHDVAAHHALLEHM